MLIQVAQLQAIIDNVMEAGATPWDALIIEPVRNGGDGYRYVLANETALLVGKQIIEPLEKKESW